MKIFYNIYFIIMIIVVIINNMMQEKNESIKSEEGKEYRGPTRLVGSFRANFSIQD